MTDFFASLYEFFGFNTLYTTDLGDYLRGLDDTCSEFIGEQYYLNFGIILFGLVIAGYVIFYYVLNSAKLNKTIHWWAAALILVATNFLIPLSLLTNDLADGDYCEELNITGFDPFGFAITSSILTLVLFILLSAVPQLRSGSTNARHTKFF